MHYLVLRSGNALHAQKILANLKENSGNTGLGQFSHANSSILKRLVDSDTWITLIRWRTKKEILLTIKIWKDWAKHSMRKLHVKTAPKSKWIRQERQIWFLTMDPMKKVLQVWKKCISKYKKLKKLPLKEETAMQNFLELKEMQRNRKDKSKERNRFDSIH